MVDNIVPCCSILISGVRKGRRGVLGLEIWPADLDRVVSLENMEKYQL